jgi:hypothetical protein
VLKLKYDELVSSFAFNFNLTPLQRGKKAELKKMKKERKKAIKVGRSCRLTPG